jgi:hypothetical protein
MTTATAYGSSTFSWRVGPTGVSNWNACCPPMIRSCLHSRISRFLLADSSAKSRTFMGFA